MSYPPTQPLSRRGHKDCGLGQCARIGRPFCRDGLASKIERMHRSINPFCLRVDLSCAGPAFPTSGVGATSICGPSSDSKRGAYPDRSLQPADCSWLAYFLPPRRHTLPTGTQAASKLLSYIAILTESQRARDPAQSHIYRGIRTITGAAPQAVSRTTTVSISSRSLAGNPNSS
jgi:hypothetical protein